MKRVFAATGLITGMLLTILPVLGQKPIKVDPNEVNNSRIWKVVNREAMVVETGGRRAIRFDEKPGQGIAWLAESQFDVGTIELEIKGKNAYQKSFLGVAFRGVDSKTYDLIYFRPYNFKSDDPEDRNHAVQYVSHPDKNWEQLRSEKTGVYEKAIEPAPDPNQWFYTRIVIADRKVRVYINDATEPCLEATELSERTGGWVGLWVGEGSGGMFANLKIIPPKKAESGNKILRLGGALKDKVKSIPKP
jgi:hypothetical protein